MGTYRAAGQPKTNVCFGSKHPLVGAQEQLGEENSIVMLMLATAV